MKKLFLLVLIVGISGILNVYSQTSTTNYTITLTGSELNSTSGLNITYALSPSSSFQLDTGISFQASGATLLLSNIDVTRNLISIVWSGNITNGVLVLNGKLAGSPTNSSNISIIKIEKAGGGDITNLIQKNVLISTDSTGTTESSPTPTPTPTTSSSSGSTAITDPVVSLEGPSIIQVLSKRVSPSKLRISASNFNKTPSRCRLTSSDNSLLTVRPKTIFLDKIRKRRFAFVRIPPRKIKEIVNTDFDDSAVIDVTCDNGASEAINVEITTNSN